MESWRPSFISSGDVPVSVGGDRLEFVAEAGPGDFIYVPPYVPHQEINAKSDEPVEAVVVRSGQKPIVVNLDIVSPEPPAETRWVDPDHPA